MSEPLRKAVGAVRRRDWNLFSIPLVVVLLSWASQCFAATPPEYYDTAEGKTGPPLRNALHQIISGHSVIPYSSTRFDTADALEILEEDLANTNNVFVLYSQESEPKNSLGQTVGWDRAEQPMFRHYLVRSRTEAAKLLAPESWLAAPIRESILKMAFREK